MARCRNCESIVNKEREDCVGIAERVKVARPRELRRGSDGSEAKNRGYRRQMQRDVVRAQSTQRRTSGATEEQLERQ